MKKTWTMMLARFPYGGVDRMETAEWVASACMWAQDNPDIEGGLKCWSVNDTPVTMCRNRAVVAALKQGIDILVMIDADMVFDIDKTHPFLPAAFEFIKSRGEHAPTIVSAPYCTGAPYRNPVMGTWRTFREGYEIKTELYTREEAASFKGIQPCPLQGTGLMMIDTRIFSGFEVGGETIKLPLPWFRYEFTDETQSVKATTEDMYFTRQATLLFAQHGLEIGYVDWDSWAYHVKPEFVGKPTQASIFDVAKLNFGTQP